MGQVGSLGGYPLEDVVDEGVHDAHGLALEMVVSEVDLLPSPCRCSRSLCGASCFSPFLLAILMSCVTVEL